MSSDKIKIGINGFGRNGRWVARVALWTGAFELVAINDHSATSHRMAQRFKYDEGVSSQWRYDIRVQDSKTLLLDEKPVMVLGERTPESGSPAPWRTGVVDVRIHINSGYREVLRKERTGVDVNPVELIPENRLTRNPNVIPWAKIGAEFVVEATEVPTEKGNAIVPLKGGAMNFTPNKNAALYVVSVSDEVDNNRFAFVKGLTTTVDSIIATKESDDGQCNGWTGSGKIKIAINGFGRTGRWVARIALWSDDYEIVAINDHKKMTYNMANSYKDDEGVKSKWRHNIKVQDSKTLLINEKPAKVWNERNPKMVPWAKFGAEFLVESTGRFTDKENAIVPLKGGAENFTPHNDSMFVVSVDKKVNPERFAVVKGLVTTVDSIIVPQETDDDPPSNKAGGVVLQAVEDRTLRFEKLTIEGNVRKRITSK